MSQRRAFTMAETLVTLSLIGILAVTMISLNTFSGNDVKIATTKITQMDTALHSWGKAISKSNETGLGAAQIITNDTELVNSLTNYLNTHGTKTVTNTTLETANGESYSNFKQIELDNGVTLNVKYVGNMSQAQKSGSDNYAKDVFASSLAVITTTASTTNGSVSEEYAVTPSEVKSLSSLFDGWDKYEIEDIGDKRMYCPGLDTCAGGCTSSNGCIETDITSKYIYIKENSRTACPSGQNGAIITRQIGSAAGVFDDTENTCCNSPQVYNKSTKVCACVKPTSNQYITLQSGYAYDYSETSTTCQKPCKKGTYASNGECKLCPEGHYCADDALSVATKCEAGYVCPNNMDKNADSDIIKKYNADKYVKNDKNKITEVKDGGLINKEKCHAGTYCSTAGLTEGTECQIGYYCPEGSISPTPCPAGTKGIKAGAKAQTEGCEACSGNTYQSKEGQTTCEICKGMVTAGGTTCEICPAGTIFQNNTCEKCKAGTYQSGNQCVPCGKGHYCPTDGMTTFNHCPCGTYQDSNRGTSCNTVEEGKFAAGETNGYTNLDAVSMQNCPLGHKCAGACNAPVECKAGTFAASPDGTPASSGGATQCKLCTAGHYCPNDGMYEPTECPAGTYQNEEGQAVYKTCGCGYYQPKTGQASCNTLTSAGYFPANASGTYTTTAAVKAQPCSAGNKCPGGCHAQEQCSEGTYQNLTAQSICNNCSAGTYQNLKGQSSCNYCGCAQWSNAGAASCSSCNTLNNDYSNYYYSNPSSGVGCNALTNKERYKDSSNCTKTACTGNYISNSDHTQCVCALSGTGLPTGKYLTANCEYACDSANHFIMSGSSCVCASGYYLNGTTCSPCYNHNYTTYQQGSASCSSTNYITTCTTPYVAVTNTEYLCGQTPTRDATKPADIVSSSCLSKSIYVFSLNLNGKEDGNSSNASNRSLANMADMTGYTSIGKSLYYYTGDWSFYAGKYASLCYNTENWNGRLCNNDDKNSMKKPSENVKYFVVEEYPYTYKNGRTTSRYKVVAYYTVSGKWIKVSNDISSISANITQGTTKLKTVGSDEIGVHGGTTYDLTGTITINGCTHAIKAGRYRHASPLVLDLKHNGLKFTSLDGGVKFDLDGDGNIEQVSWTTEQKEFDNAFLCLDKNENGQIDSGKELFGDQYGEESGFDELAKYDDNGDGRITKADAAYEKLQLWCDMNKNGKVDAGELRNLADEKITELSAKYEKKYDKNGDIVTDENGNITGYQGTFKHIVEEVVDGAKTLVEKIGEMIDVFFQMIKNIF